MSGSAYVNHTLYLNQLTISGQKLSGLAAPTASGDATNKAYVDALVASAATTAASAVTSLIDSAPEALNTLNELSVALANNPNFATSITTVVSNETTRAQAAELVLTNNLDTANAIARNAESANAAAISAEASTARAAEAANSAATTAEAARAQAAETDLYGQVANETNRAEAAETTNAAAISAEAARATAAEAAILNSLSSASTDSVAGLAAIKAYLQAHWDYFHANQSGTVPVPNRLV